MHEPNRSTIRRQRWCKGAIVESYLVCNFGWTKNIVPIHCGAGTGTQTASSPRHVWSASNPTDVVADGVEVANPRSRERGTALGFSGSLFRDVLCFQASCTPSVSATWVRSAHGFVFRYSSKVSWRYSKKPAPSRPPVCNRVSVLYHGHSSTHSWSVVS